MEAAGERRYPGRAALAWVPALLVVPLAMAGAVEVSQPVDKGAAMRQVLPIDLGTTWVYDVSDHGKPSGTRTRQIVSQAGLGDKILDSVAETSHYTDYPGSGEIHDLVYLGVSGDQLLQYGLFSNNEYQELDPPLPAYELPVEKGHSWSYDGQLGSGLKISLTATLAELTDVEVNGRTFHGCAHFQTEQHLTFSDDSRHDEHYQEWTCPGYGPVKSIDQIPDFDVDVTEELTEFHGRAGNWSADDATTVRATPTPGDAQGFDSARSRSLPQGELGSRLAWSDSTAERFSFPPVATDDLTVLAERDGEVWARDTTTGEVKWRVRLTGPIVAAPALDGQDVLVADADKHLWSLRLADGSTRWVRELGDMVSAPPTVIGTSVVVPTEDSRVTSLDLGDGRQLWQTNVTAALQAAPAADDGLVVLADPSGAVTAVDVATGRTRWARTLDGNLAVAPSISDGTVVTGDDNGVLYAFDTTDGSVRWESRSDHEPGGGAAIGGDTVVSAGFDHIEGRRLSDGHLLWSRAQPHSTAAPVIVGQQVVSVSTDGRVDVRSLGSGEVTDGWQLPAPTSDAALDIEVPIATIAGTLVFGGLVTAEAHEASLWAYPLTEEAQTAGVWFDTEVRVLPANVAAPPLLHDGTLLVPAQDNHVYASSAGGQARSLVQSKGLQPGIALDGDLLIAQKDDEIQALPLAGGPPAWTFPAADPYPGSVPAVAGDTVFVPEYGLGLAAVTTADGSPRWFQPITNAIGTSAPVPLPGGDVVYGSGSVARYDGDTGAQQWSVPDTQLFSAASYADGVVYADLVRNTHPNGLAALDAATGRQLWFHTHQIGIVVGPVVGDGVVVDTDDVGLVTGYDARTGNELWHLQLSTPIAGEPVISDGHVAIAETGREEDVYQRDQRVTVLDVHSGRFVGGFQSPGPGYLKTAALGATPDGGLLLPATSRLGSIVMILEQHHD